MSETWQQTKRAAAARFGPWIRPVLAAVARRAWGPDVVVVDFADVPAWRAYLALGRSSAAGYRYLELGVVATIDPSGELVALQVVNGEDFLALVDTSPSGLERGLTHLLSLGRRERHYAEPPFVPQARPDRAGAALGWLVRWLHRVRGSR